MNPRIYPWLIMIIIALLSPLYLASQDRYRQSLSVNIGVDYSILTLQVVYSQALEIPGWDRDLTWDLGYSLPLLKPDFKDFRVSTGIQVEPFRDEHLSLPVALHFLYRGTSNGAYQARGFGTELRLSPGFYSEQNSLALELSWDHQLLTQIRYSSFYQEQVYGEAVEGWFLHTADTLRFGIFARQEWNENLANTLRGGYEYHGKYNFKVPPIYGFLGTTCYF